MSFTCIAKKINRDKLTSCTQKMYMHPNGPEDKFEFKGDNFAQTVLILQRRALDQTLFLP